MGKKPQLRLDNAFCAHRVNGEFGIALIPLERLTLSFIFDQFCMVVLVSVAKEISESLKRKMPLPRVIIKGERVR